MAGKINRRDVAGLDLVEEALPGAQEFAAGRILGLHHLKADILQRRGDRARVVDRLAQLLVGFQVVVTVDADDERHALRLRGRDRKSRQSEQDSKQATKATHVVNFDSAHGSFFSKPGCNTSSAQNA